MFSLRITFLIALAGGLALGGCAGDKPSLTSNGVVQVVQQGALPSPSTSEIISRVRPYRIGPLDKLDISVFGVEGLEAKEVETDASGNIAFPLAGTIQAVGLTTSELAAEITRRLKASFVRDPQVTVNLNETVSQLVTVDGQVTRPGMYQVIGDMTLTGAVASAGGLSEFANLQDVVIFRTIEGQKMAGLYSLRAIRSRRYEDPEVFPSDIVIVGDSPQRRRFKDLLQVAPLLASPLIVLLQSNGK